MVNIKYGLMECRKCKKIYIRSEVLKDLIKKISKKRKEIYQINQRIACAFVYIQFDGIIK